MGSDFTNFHAGCHGPVPFEMAICGEDAFPMQSQSDPTRRARARGRLEVYGTSVMTAKRSAREQPGFEAVASEWRSSFRWFALMTVTPTVSVGSV